MQHATTPNMVITTLTTATPTWPAIMLLLHQICNILIHMHTIIPMTTVATLYPAATATSLPTIHTAIATNTQMPTATTPHMAITTQTTATHT